MHHCKTRIGTMGIASCKALALAIAVAACLPAHAAGAAPAAAQETVVKFDIPAGDLSAALEKFSTQSGIQAMYRQELVSGKRAQAVSGTLSPAAALARLLAGTGLAYERVNDRTYVLKAAEPVPAKRSPIRAPKPEPQAKESAQHGAATELDTVVVVGSRLGVSPVESAMPIKVITREDIDRSGAGNIAQALTYLSEVSLNNTGDREIGGTGVSSTSGANANSSTVQMRGLPRGTTLVLINGRRAGDSAMFSSTGQFDLSTIPLALVERIEVLPAGASAVYGGDGLAGVINVVLRRDAEGWEMRMRKTVADGYDRDMLSAMWGKAWERGNLTVAFNWNRNSALFSSERRLTADQDFRRFGGKDERSPYADPATIYSWAGCPASGGCYIPVATRGPLPGLDSPMATVPSGSDGRNLAPSDFLATQGQANKTSTKRHLISAEHNRGISLSGRTEVFSGLEVFSELAYTRRSVPARQLEFVLFDGNSSVFSRVAADHPYNPFGVPVGVDYRYNDTGLYATFAQTHMRALLGARGTLGRFDWELTGIQSRDKAATQGALQWDRAKVSAALVATDPAKALNPFVADGSAPASREFLASLLGTDLNHDTASRGDVWTGFIRGPVFKLPAGEVQGLVGWEAQRQEIRLDTNTPTLTTRYINGVTRSSAAFAEARVPILSARAGSSRERLVLTGAMRRESSDRFNGDTQTKTFGLEAWATEKLLLRSTYSTAFRPLLAYSVVQDVEPQTTGFYDPKFGGRLFLDVPALRGGGVPPELGPENSTTITMGLLYRPSADWNVSLTHWDMKFRDRIAYISPDTLLANEAYFPSRVIRDPATGVVTLMDLRQINMSRYDSAGVDIAADAYVPTGIGEFSAGLSASYIYKHETQLTDDSPSENNVAIRRNDGWAPRWKIVPRVGWAPREGIHAMMAGRYVSHYRDSQAFSTGPKTGEFPVLGGFWILDLNADIELGGRLGWMDKLGDTRLSLGVTNVLDKQPEFCAGCGAGRGYDASIYDIVGRTYYAELRLSF